MGLVFGITSILKLGIYYVQEPRGSAILTYDYWYGKEENLNLLAPSVTYGLFSNILSTILTIFQKEKLKGGRSWRKKILLK